MTDAERVGNHVARDVFDTLAARNGDIPALRNAAHAFRRCPKSDWAGYPLAKDLAYAVVLWCDQPTAETLEGLEKQVRPSKTLETADERERKLQNPGSALKTHPRTQHWWSYGNQANSKHIA